MVIQNMRVTITQQLIIACTGYLQLHYIEDAS